MTKQAVSSAISPLSIIGTCGEHTLLLTVMMFAVKVIYLYNCWKEPAAHKQPWKISESWCGVMRGEKKVSTGYEKGTDTGNGHIWCGFIVSGVSHSNLITAAAQSWAWHGYIHFSFGIRQNYCSSFAPRTGVGISLSFWGESVPELYL